MGYLDYAGLQYLWGKLKEKFAPKSHSHDDRYYTEAEMDGKLNSKSNTNHTHDASTLINALGTGAAAPTDPDYIITQWVGGGTSNTTWVRRPMSSIWNYIKSKADSVYQPKGSYAASGHTHDDRYYTEAEINSKLDGKSNTGHTHDDRYYTETEIDTKLNGKAPNGHTHQYLSLYGARPANINFTKSTNGTGAMFHFVATSSTTTGKPPADSSILQLNWDNNGGWDSQLALSTTASPHVYYRNQQNGTWGNWSTLLDNLNYTDYAAKKEHTHTKAQITDFPASLKNPTALTIQTNGTTAATYDGSAAKTVNITKGNIGLGNVDNTADANKSVKYATSAGSANTATKATIAGTADNATTSNGVKDYNDANKTIKIGFAGAGLTAENLNYIAGYTDNGTKIKDVSKDVLKSWIGLGNYLPLIGGTMSGQITKSTGGSWIGDRDRAAIKSSYAGDSSYGAVAAMATKNGYWTMGNLGGNESLIFNYSTDAKYNAGKNETSQVYLPAQAGTIITSATIGSQSVNYANSAGTANVANSVDWSKVQNKPSSYAPASHTHDDRYYTESEVNTKLANYQPKGNYAAASHTHNYAGSGSAGGSANSAIKLDSSAGSATQPVYFKDGKPVATTYTLNKTVPADAKFTDTNTWRGIQNNLTSDSTDQSLSAAQGKALKTLVDGKAPTSHKHTKSQITDFPTSMPASDVSAWAKAATKPSYTKAEVGLSNVDNTADKDKSVKYATSAGSASQLNGFTIQASTSDLTAGYSRLNNNVIYHVWRCAMSIVVRGCHIGEGRPKVIIPIVEMTESKILERAFEFSRLRIDCVEWRVDWFEQCMDAHSVVSCLQKLRVALKDKLLLVTFRTKAEGGEVYLTHKEYLNFINTAIDTDCADLIDIEFFTAGNDIRELIDNAHSSEVVVVCSSHDFQKTPDKNELISRMVKMQQVGADLPKVAVMPHDSTDVLTLLAATVDMKNKYFATPIITISMGKLGIVSRLCGELFGSAMTFASAGDSSAPGQIGLDVVNAVLDSIAE